MSIFAAVFSFVKAICLNFSDKTMKCFLSLFTALTFGYIIAFAQPTVSYILPDIGTPNMNTYLEVYAPYNADGTFGPDGISLNNPGDAVRLRLVNPADSSKVIIGPLIISWNGKLISTHIFVRPTLPFPPNSDDWERLSPEFRIPIEVTVNGVRSNIDTFYIVRPFRFGDKTGNPERVLGAGSLGKRSRRGAMLVDSMVLAPGTYTVNTADCDPSTPGNQGYLPFILLAQGVIQSPGGTTVQTNGNGMNGGPGGGGGAGRSCDATLVGGGADGSNGGDGYTGGARGGRNNKGVPPLFDRDNVYKFSGAGSGRNLASQDIGGLSLNGVPGGEAQPNTVESAGGGTGHPFGLSGTGWNGSNSNTITGGYGGGTGQSQSEQGGAGGYGTDGDSPTRSNGGKMHGNKCVVPIAGGSGGASGNPQEVTGGCAGGGGGGGGAIRVAARAVLNVNFSSVGGLGEDQGTRGGSGAGGHIGLQAKLNIAAWSSDVRGGGYSTPANTAPRGGHGRFRYDCPVMQPPTSTNIDGSLFQGPTTDTQSVVKRVFTLRGSGNGLPVIIFIKPEFGPWTIVDSTIAGYQNTWFLPIDLNDPRIFRDSRYYIVGAQRITNPDSRPYLMEPDVVMSQSAANIIIIADQPIIASQRSRILSRVICPGASSFDTLQVKNDGAADLIIDPPIWKKGNQGFSVISPAFPMKIAPQSAGNIIVKFQPPLGTNLLTFSDSLILNNNDPEKGKSPWSIEFLSSRDTLFTQFLNRTNSVVIDTIDFGKLCLGESSYTSATLQNRSSKRIAAAMLNLTDRAHFDAAFSGATIADAGEDIDLAIGFTARSRGKMTARMIVVLDECDFADTLVLIGEGIETQLEFTGTGQFSRTRVGTTKTLEVELKNTGNAPAELSNFPPALPAPFRIISVQPASPIIPPGGTVKIQVEYTPTNENFDTAFLEIRSLTLANTCPDTARLLFAGQGISSDLRTSAPSFIFGNTSQCDFKDDSVTLKNYGAADATLTEQAIITGQNYSAFSIIKQPATPYVLHQGDSVQYIIRFNAPLGTAGLNTAILTIPTDDLTQPRIDLPISGRKETPQIKLPQNIISGGIIPVPQSVDISFPVENLGTIPVSIVSVLSSRSTVTPQTILMNPNDIVSFNVKMTANQGGIIRDTARIIFAQPCPDTQNVIIEITAVEATLSFGNMLDFGKIASCETALDSVVFANSGLAPLQILDMQITGPDAADFTFTAPVSFPVILNSTERFIRYVMFNPANSTDGIKSAEITTKALLNGTTRDFLTRLRGERETPLLAAPGNVVFGIVEMLTSAQQRLTITNISSRPITIDRVQWAKGGIFTATLDPPRPRPTTIAPGETVTMTIEFIPQTAGDFIDTLQLLQSSPCDDIRKITVTGIGKPTLRSTVILPTDKNVDPSAIDYHIPIRLRLTPANIAMTNASFLAEFTVDERLFVPTSAIGGTLTTSINSATRQRTIRIVGDNFSTSEPESIIAEVRGVALLGSIEQDSLRWVQFNWTAGTPARVDSMINGHLQFVLCEKGGKRLLNDDEIRVFGLVAAPIPADENLTVKAYSVEIGDHILELVNSQGRIVFSERWNIGMLTPSGYAREINLPTELLASGIYSAILRTPTKTSALRVVIVK